MSETKFTKGEWVADIRIGCCAVYPSSSTDGWEQWLCDDAKNLFYKRYHNDFMNPECKNLSIEHVANANLIAAAPEMYAMLSDLANDYSCQCGHPRCSKENQKREIQDLLAKARGEV